MNKRKIKLEARAKINLSINITGVANNMHTLDMVMASVDLSDAITVCERFDSKVNIEFDSPFFIGDNSTVHKAVTVLRSKFGDFGADIFITKRIPQMGGLGGSSADAGAVIFALDKLLNLSERGLAVANAGLMVGSDVPYMIYGGNKRVYNLGETIQPYENNCIFNLVILSSENGVSTKQAYELFDKQNVSKKLIVANNDKLVLALKNADRKQAFLHMGNALFGAAVTLVPQIQSNLNLLIDSGAQHAFLTGSGACVVGIFDSELSATVACAKLARAGHSAITANTVDSGIKIIS